MYNVCRLAQSAQFWRHQLWETEEGATAAKLQESAYEICRTVLSGNERFGVARAVWAYSPDWHCLPTSAILHRHFCATSRAFLLHSQQLDQFLQNLVLTIYIPQSNYTDIFFILKLISNQNNTYPIS